MFATQGLGEKLLRIVQIVNSILVLFALACTSGASEGIPLQCETVPRLMDAYLSRHVTYHELSDEIKNRTIANYLRRIDPSKMLLLRGEADAVRQQLQGVFSTMRQGDCNPLSAIQRDLIEHYGALEVTVRDLLKAPDFHVDPTTSIIIDPEKRGFPETAEEQQQLRESLIQFQISNYVSSGTPLDEAKQKLIHRYELLTRRAIELTPSDLEGDFLDSFALALDPHSRYLASDEYDDFGIDMKLSLDGIGVALISRDGYSIVEKVIPGGATDRSNALKPNDKIIAVAQDGEKPVDIIDMALRDVVRMIRGQKGTKVHLTVLRQEEKTERFTVTIVRDTIDLKEQAASLRFENRKSEGETLKLAILTLPSFYGDGDPEVRSSATDVSKLLTIVDAERADGLLLDLSRNGGGLLEEAIKITGFFIYRGGIVAAQEADSPAHIYTDPDRGIRYKGPLVVLISRISASASEILTGAMKDYDRAVIVGDTHTFGKGSVQNVKELPAGLGALKITMAMYYRPGGDSTQLTGVISDIRVPSLFDTDDFGEATYDYPLPPKKIRPYQSTAANVDAPPERWKPITPTIIKALQAKAEPRIAKNEDFQKVEETLAKRKADGERLTLSDLLREREQQKESMLNPLDQEAVPGEDDHTPTAQVNEALNILADLVIDLQDQKSQIVSK